ncbi:Thiol:disulfide interchange protein DsbD precursor [Aggregatibacter actinomycetemcomitans]|nr:thiol:disulfide interchange protein [Aggregatibacter actinomycetemcomitans D11S-1]AEW76117.1 thiol:disulfide interchange protein DsbD [Aggregatibacter actinomycetemcomitans ANH9381]AHN72926.1 not yet annotated [Aggregatibacter actinomycetemcomitans HK1651]AMQ92218.1 thiol:disulfide interchange protein [Aggregatibacter actinomycetemcomitans]KND83475.1 thiol:disulfide interchange protein [Aggregatibacter actinomycetemcomitans serotype b str. SCC1398]KOE51983.1 thiol:disulfide interchange prot
MEDNNRFMKRFLLIILCFFVTFNVQAVDLFNQKPKFLPVDQAFQLQAEQYGNDISLNWQIVENYYLYQDKLEFALNGQPIESQPQFLSRAEQYEDPYFGTVQIFKHQLPLRLSLPNSKPQDILEVTYQGCTPGFCYPPKTKQFMLGELPHNAVETSLVAQEETKSAVRNPSVFSSQQNQLADSLFQSKYAMLWFFVLGIGLAFTPCVLPMLPLLSAIVIGNRTEHSHTWRAFTLSFMYVQGMALTYTLLGLLVVLIGLPFQVALQSPYVLIGLSVVFTLLALSMFGVFTLQLPPSLQTKLTQLSQQQKRGAFFGVFAMGAIAGLVASPCTSAPLSGALLYVAQSGDLVIGALTLYLLALGMGLPLILITVFGNKILPKSGAWMENVKTAFGFVMLALPVFLLSRVLPLDWEPRLWALLGVSFFIWLATQMHTNGIGLLFRILFLIAAITLAQPLQNWLWQNNTDHARTHSAVKNSLEFQSVQSYEELQLVLTKNPKPLALLDLYADWCVACKEFEHKTFAEPQVQDALKDVLLLRIDMTNNSENNRTLMKQLSITGLPTLMLFNPQGKEISSHRITGFMEGEAFLQTLQAAKALNN